MIEEREYSDTGEGWGLSRHHRYTWGADLSGSLQGAGGVGGLLMTEAKVFVSAIVDPGQPLVAHYYWYDGNGNVIGITDDTDAIEGTYRYTSFGALTESAINTPYATAQPWKFSTKYHDTEVEPVAGTDYYGLRHYLPSVGRLLNRDPIEEEGGTNLYGFVANDPNGKIDRHGPEMLPWHERPDRNLPPPQSAAEMTQRLYASMIHLFGELVSSCPSEGQSVTMSGGAMQTFQKTQCRMHDSCVEQAKKIVDRMTVAALRVILSQQDRWGWVPNQGGWSGNLRAYSAPYKGLLDSDADAGCGLKCFGWQDLMATEFSKALAQEYGGAGKLCFRGAGVEKGVWAGKHAWFQIYSIGDFQPTVSNHITIVDPWRSGGADLSPSPYGYNALRFSGPDVLRCNGFLDRLLLNFG